MIQAACTLLAVVGFELFTAGPEGGGFQRLIDFTTPVFWFFLAALGSVSRGSALASEPEHARPFRVPGYPFVPLLFCGGSAGIVYAGVVHAIEVRSWAALWAAGLMAPGVVLSPVVEAQHRVIARRVLRAPLQLRWLRNLDAQGRRQIDGVILFLHQDFAEILRRGHTRPSLRIAALVADSWRWFPTRFAGRSAACLRPCPMSSQASADSRHAAEIVDLLGDRQGVGQFFARMRLHSLAMVMYVAPLSTWL